MKELIRFSLFRRFKNRSTMAFNIILFVGIGLICFSDCIVNLVNPSMLNNEIIYTKNIEQQELTYLNESINQAYTFKATNKKTSSLVSEGDSVLTYKKGRYVLASKYQTNESTMALMKMTLSNYHRHVLIQSKENAKLLNKYNKNVKLSNTILNKDVDISEDKSNLVFMVMTSIYFMMLGFINSVATEVVNEKSTKTLELVLTSVSAKAHFISKMIVGWLVVVIQSFMSASYIIFFVILRTLYDSCSGLIKFVNQLQIYRIDKENIFEVINSAGLSIDLFVRILFVILFLMLGILLVQLVLVIVSSFVSSVEEAGNIQAPFYLILLAVYYIAISLNNPYELSEGIAYYLSFVPFFNMLFMPCRLLVVDVEVIELCLSLLFSLCLISFVVVKGSKIYEIGVLDYSGKSLKEIVLSLK